MTPSFIIANPSPTVFVNYVNETLVALTTLFETNQLLLNLDKTTFLQFRTKNSKKLDFNISSSKDQIPKNSSIKFLGLLIDETLTWKSHITHLSKRLGFACYALRAITPDPCDRHTENGLFCICPLINVVRYNFWGKLFPFHRDFHDSEKSNTYHN
jgi:hypothetical protein